MSLQQASHSIISTTVWISGGWLWVLLISTGLLCRGAQKTGAPDWEEETKVNEDGKALGGWIGMPRTLSDEKVPWTSFAYLPYQISDSCGIIKVDRCRRVVKILRQRYRWVNKCNNELIKNNWRTLSPSSCGNEVYVFDDDCKQVSFPSH